MPGVVVFGSLVLSLVAGTAVTVPRSGSRWQRRLLWVAGGLLLLLTVSMAAYVFGEDDYRDNGTSRWSTYGAQGVSAAAIAVAGVATGCAAGALRRARVAGLVPITTVAAAVVNFIALAEMTN